MPFSRVLSASLLIFLSLRAQNIEEAIKYFDSFQFDKAKEIFLQLAKDESNPRIAEVYYYLARLSVNPDSSIMFYRKIINNYPQSRYADDAYLEIAKSSIARSDHKSSIIILNELLKNYPDTELKEEILFWLGIAHIESGNEAEGIKLLNELKENYPKSIWAVRASSIALDTIHQSVYYTIQVGSYRTEDNAQKCVEELKKKGFEARIVEAFIKGETFYRVWVGKFETAEQAKSVLQKLDSIGYKGNVVKGY
ncbi:MAG: SPOR domain-containing protein [candidate division WOR-3 bacterium]